MDEVCANCGCELGSGCCGTGRPYVLDEIAYCCEACAVDGECECGCIASAAPTGEATGAPPGPTI